MTFFNDPFLPAVITLQLHLLLPPYGHLSQATAWSCVNSSSAQFFFSGVADASTFLAMLYAALSA